MASPFHSTKLLWEIRHWTLRWLGKGEKLPAGVGVSRRDCFEAKKKKLGGREILLHPLSTNSPSSKVTMLFSLSALFLPPNKTKRPASSSVARWKLFVAAGVGAACGFCFARRWPGTRPSAKKGVEPGGALTQWTPNRPGKNRDYNNNIIKDPLLTNQYDMVCQPRGFWSLPGKHIVLCVFLGAYSSSCQILEIPLATREILACHNEKWVDIGNKNHSPLFFSKTGGANMSVFFLVLDDWKHIFSSAFFSHESCGCLFKCASEEWLVIHLGVNYCDLYMDVSENRGTPKWMVYNRNPY